MNFYKRYCLVIIKRFIGKTHMTMFSRSCCGLIPVQISFSRPTSWFALLFPKILLLSALLEKTTQLYPVSQAHHVCAASVRYLFIGRLHARRASVRSTHVIESAALRSVQDCTLQKISAVRSWEGTWRDCF